MKCLCSLNILQDLLEKIGAAQDGILDVNRNESNIMVTRILNFRYISSMLGKSVCVKVCHLPALWLRIIFVRRVTAFHFSWFPV